MVHIASFLNEKLRNFIALNPPGASEPLFGLAHAKVFDDSSEHVKILNAED
jgi:hypothetical protein